MGAELFKNLIGKIVIYMCAYREGWSKKSEWLDMSCYLILFAFQNSSKYQRGKKSISISTSVTFHTSIINECQIWPHFFIPPALQ